ncbi:MAG: hypothetical protein CMJ89_13730 [Planctomycetes bacterium]|jgi:hypothetical protein|nr:hypothetical protein [Planctomycetota bacterium]
MKKLTLLGVLLLLGTNLFAQNWRSLKIDEEHRAAKNLIHWQRRLADAEFLSKRTGVPLLICVNMDGESASEAFAHRKYKDEKFAELTRGFVCVIASPTRHNSRDYDERGRRIACPRFGEVTCREHISIEPYMYAKYFGGLRYAPRHLGVSAGGATIFDHFLNQDLSVVGLSLERHGKNIAEIDASFERDAVARSKMEREFLASDAKARLALLKRARSSTPPQYDLIRLGLHDESAEVRERAAKALAGAIGPESVDLVFEALRSGAAKDALKALRKRIAPLAKDDKTAAKALRILIGLDSSSKIVNRNAWKKAIGNTKLAAAERNPEDIDLLLEKLKQLDHQQKESPTAACQEATARTLLDIAKARMAKGSDPTYFLIDARSAAERADAEGATHFRTAAIRAEAAYLLSEFEVALELASQALPKHLKLAAKRETADLLGVFAQLRAKAIYDAEDKQEQWPASWLSDAHSAYQALTLHPHASESQFVGYSSLLTYLGLEHENGDVLRRALARFPLSGELHQQFRDHVWRSDGPFGLERAYERVDLSERPAAYTWFRAYASLVCAEHLRRLEKAKESRSAYERAIRLFEDSTELEGEFRENSNHFIALALAELAFLALEREDLSTSSELIVQSLERRPESSHAADGLGRSPHLILQRVLQELERAEAKTQIDVLKERIEKISPGYWEES